MATLCLQVLVRCTDPAAKVQRKWRLEPHFQAKKKGALAGTEEKESSEACPI
jgi:hypothetical protein